MGYAKPKASSPILVLSDQALPLLVLLSSLPLTPQMLLQISGALMRNFWTPGIF